MSGSGNNPYDDVLRMAINLARNASYAVFPCGDNKRPTRPSEEGVLHGFHDATTDPAQIAWLWANWPGSLIGVATGTRSGVSVLDIDPDHPEAFLWWEDNHERLPSTRTYRTRRGGAHLWMQHREGVTNSQNKATWFRLVSVPLGNATPQYPNGDHVQAVEPWIPPKTWEGLHHPPPPRPRLASPGV